MSDKIHAYAAINKGDKLKPFEYDPGALGANQVEIAVEYCGVCHSDLSMLNNEWGMTEYPLVPGHEVVGKIRAVGEHVTDRQVGQRVGLGWFSGCCMACHNCLSGDHNLCSDSLRCESTIIRRHGGFADRVRAHWVWTQPLPDTLDYKKAGPLFCGGITVFNPIVQNNVKPTDRAGVIGIGGLGHLALAFLNKWGCEVTAFTSSDSKREEALKLGAHKIVNTRDKEQLKKIAGSLNFILSTVSATLDWNEYIGALAPKGRFVTVGIFTEPIQLAAFPLIAGQKSFGGSPLGSPSTIEKMIEFSARHSIAPVTESFKMSEINEAFERLKAGKARYRIVLTNDIV
jgi:alcohol/geraniol dehydrogenase (NADP+)